MTEQSSVVADLAADVDTVDRMVAPLASTQWTFPTPAPGWSIAHQVAHLAAAFRLATLAATEPDRFLSVTAAMAPNFAANVDQTLTEYLAEPCDVLLSRWRTERARVQAALGALPPSQEVPWLIRPIPASVLAAVGMMELFGHGQDIADALGRTRPAARPVRSPTPLIAER